jgi:hypothetical protein
VGQGGWLHSELEGRGGGEWVPLLCRCGAASLTCCIVVCIHAGRLDFHKASYKCSECGEQRWQGWAELLQLGYFPMSLHANCATFVEVCELERIRQEMRCQSPTGWGSRAEAISAVGARLYNQVGCLVSCLQGFVTCSAQLLQNSSHSCGLQQIDTRWLQQPEEATSTVVACDGRCSWLVGVLSGYNTSSCA